MAASVRAGGPPPAPAAGSRVLSIDALRGFDMLWLIGGKQALLAFAAALHVPFLPALRAQFQHSEWLGFTFWDFIASLFLFVVGLAIPYSIEGRLKKGRTRAQAYAHIVRRTLLLFALGLVFNGILQLDFTNFRYAGVLQRIGLSYCGAALLYMACGIRGQAFWTAALLLGYWAAMALIPVPGFGAGVYTPEGNLAGYIDRLFLPGSFCCYVHGDNEGYLSTIPSGATVLLGVLCAHLLRSGRSHGRKLAWLGAGSAASLALGWLWSGSFPITSVRL